MSDHQRIVPGVFCWPELCSAGIEPSREFYSQLFGWDAREEKMPDGSYWTFLLGGKGVAGMYQAKPERLAAGVKPHWNVYIAVEDAVATANRVAELGGKITGGPFTEGHYTMANLQDPFGAGFCVWQLDSAVEQTLINAEGAMCWSELYTPDKEEAAAFYSGVFGWEAKPFQAGPMPYTTLNLPGQERGVGGMIQLTPEMQGWAPQWIPYIMVADAAALATRAGELGGRLLFPAMPIEGVGTISMLVDPQGATLAFIQPAM